MRGWILNAGRRVSTHRRPKRGGVNGDGVSYLFTPLPLVGVEVPAHLPGRCPSSVATPPEGWTDFFSCLSHASREHHKVISRRVSSERARHRVFFIALESCRNLGTGHRSIKLFMKQPETSGSYVLNQVGTARCATGIELRPRFNASHDSLNLNPNRNLNLPRDFGSKSKSKITIKNFAKCVNSMAVARCAVRAAFSGASTGLDRLAGKRLPPAARGRRRRSAASPPIGVRTLNTSSDKARGLKS